MENDEELSRWTEDRLRTLDLEWSPDVGRARALLDRKRQPETHAKIYICATAVTILAIVWIWTSQRPQTTLAAGPDVIYIAPQDRKAAPDFTLRDTAGKSVRLSSERGKVVVLNFWATWCEPCKAEVPWLVQFQKARSAAGFEVLSVALDADNNALEPWMKSNRVNYRVLLGNEEITDLFGGVMTLPATVVIDRSGRIAGVQSGMYKRNEINAVLSEVIAPERQFQR